LLGCFWYRGSFPRDFTKCVAVWRIIGRGPRMCRCAVCLVRRYHRTGTELLVVSGNLRCYVSWGCFRTNLYPIDWGCILVLGKVSNCVTNRSQSQEHQNSPVNLQFISVLVGNYLHLSSIFFLFTRRMNVEKTAKCKIDKAVPFQAWTGPECSRKLKLTDLKTIGTWRW
jgi:hypothetical protein